MPELRVSDIPDVHADCAFPQVQYLGPPTLADGVIELGYSGAQKSATGMHSPWGGDAATGRAGPAKRWHSLPLEEAAAVRELGHLRERLHYQVESLGTILRSPS